MKKIYLLLALLLAFSFTTPVYAAAIQPSSFEIPVEDESGDYIVGTIIIPDDIQPFYTETGDIVGDGVNLRKAPNRTSTILEKMYNGEIVYIDYQHGPEVWEDGYQWLYIQHKKTGTYGYVYGKYVWNWN